MMMSKMQNKNEEELTRARDQQSPQLTDESKAGEEKRGRTVESQ